MSTLLFYENIVPLNRERHKSLRLKGANGDCSFAARSTFVPLAGTEFVHAARNYPILFSGAGEQLTCVALLGLSENQNLFVGDDKRWAGGHYLPAFIRHYPFVLAHGNDKDKDSLTVCFDSAYEGMNEEEGQPLFTEEGKDSELLTNTISFLQLFQQEMLRTRAFMEKLQELELLRQRDLQVSSPDKGSYLVKDFQIIDEERLASLSDEQFLELRTEGYLPWIYAHLVSLGNTANLHSRLPVKN